MSGTIRTHEDDDVCTVVIDNEPKRNAITHEMMDGLASTLDTLADERAPPVVILRGAGDDAFSAGFDLTQDRDPTDGSWSRMIDAVAGYAAPTIAMVDGDAFGGAVHLALACDLRVGRHGTRLGVPAAKLGLVYPPDGIERLVAVIGPAATKAMLFTGDPIDAERARALGLLNRLVPPAELASATNRLAETMSANAPLSLAGTKAIVNAIVQGGSLSGERREWAQERFRAAFETRDFEEGKAAFDAGRSPSFEGR